MTNKKHIQNLEEEVKRLSNAIEELNGNNKQKAKAYDETQELLKNVNLKVRKISNYINNNGQVCVGIELALPQIRIEFDDFGNTVRNEKMISVALLNILDLNEIHKINEAIEIAKERNKA